MDDWTMVNSYFRPNRNEDNPDAPFYWPVPRFDPNDPPGEEISLRDMFFKKWLPAARAAGRIISDKEAEERYQKWIASYEGPGARLKRQTDV